ncbi:YqjF family protein [Isoptericola croceus]|uniref:YqjF family protein n=1 Tax=Isoptericola croceus TaxID=3031406 RepID=UPI0023F821F4|nr:DUF2071 domain-containing protein [Isoptericola croceus]
MPSVTPPERILRAASLQRWESVTFLHWAYPPGKLQRLLPPGLEIDVVEGTAWLGVTPLAMRGVRPGLLPPVPGWSDFLEVNVRTYVHHPASGTDGVWFLRLVCPRAAMVVAMRALGVPYRRFAGSVEPGRDATRYRGNHARWGSIDVTVHPGERVAEPSPWLVAVTGRWNAYTWRAGRLWRVPVEHPPWPLHRATVTGTSDLVRHTGLQPPVTGPTVSWSPGVDVRLGLPRPLPRG